MVSTVGAAHAPLGECQESSSSGGFNNLFVFPSGTVGWLTCANIFHRGKHQPVMIGTSGDRLAETAAGAAMGPLHFPWPLCR